MKKNLTKEQLKEAYCHLSKVIADYLAIYNEYAEADLEPTLERLSEALTSLEKLLREKGIDISTLNCNDER